ncbi:hypothetical protein RIF29_03770 [Crotalaria pallida]|uniref:Uncharacterized protein n=1 Tax=Crotalaria pallida TaxID=3830 RepID=A0AAN9J0A7_CROPI
MNDSVLRSCGKVFVAVYTVTVLHFFHDSVFSHLAAAVRSFGSSTSNLFFVLITLIPQLGDNDWIQIFILR